MNSTRIIWTCVVLALLLGTGTAFAQTTGNISGRVENEGQGLPGVSVTAKSPQLQGVRTTVTSVNGDYYFANLPAGQYTIRMELSGFAPHEEQVRLGVAQKATVNAVLNLKSVEATATVVARSEQVSTGSADSATYTSETLNKLPVARTLVSAVSLAPGINQNGPSGAITISGAQSFENVMTVNGAQIQDNVRLTPNNLFIEDAVQETTTTSSGISAEFGRFTGGVINTITKSGGNNFSGSFRATLNNGAWRELTPYPGDTYNFAGTLPTYEATLGGPFWKDHVWFFGAYRGASTSGTGTTAPPTSLGFATSTQETRWEGRLTFTPIQNQTLTGSYMNIATTQDGYYFPNVPIFDLNSVYSRQLPQNFWVINYNGVLTESLFLEGQYSQRHFTFVNSGGTSQDLITGSTVWSLSPNGVYNSPIFCAVCPGSTEKRDNFDYFGKLNWFVSTKGLGSHNMVIGFDTFQGSRQSNNYQSGTNYAMNVNTIIYQNGQIYPVITEGSYLGYYPILNVAQPSKVKTQSAFFNDTWKLNDNFSFNLGVRYDKNHVTDPSGAVTADDSKWSPRLGIIWDPTGKGTLRVNGGYAIYVAAPAETQVSAGSNAGAPAAFGYYYGGPDINTNPAGPFVSTHDALAAFFNWFGITGLGQFPSRGNTTPDAFVSVPGVNRLITPAGLISPSTTEWTAGVGGSVGRRFTYRVEGVYRSYKDFYAIQTDMSTGQVTDTLGNTFDLGYVINGEDPLMRKYYGLHTNFQWRPWDPLNIGGSWTWSHTYGNNIGETSGSGPVRDVTFQYPEYHDFAAFQPVGNLPQDQRHRLRVFGSWDFPFPKTLGHLGLGFLYRMDTGLPYGASSATGVATRAYVTNPGYEIPPTSVQYYFTARDAFRTPTLSALDLSLNYGINIGPVEIFVQPQVINVFNNAVINYTDSSALGQTVETAVNRSANYAGFNPFTTVPVQGPRNTGANWNYGATFGQALATTAYETPLTFRISMGIRF